MPVPAKPWRVFRRPDGSRWAELGGQWVRVFSRKEFLAHYWNYEYGDHAAIYGPTQLAGKTRLMFDLLANIDVSGLKIPPTMLVCKPKDDVVKAGLARLGWQETDRWPVRAVPWRKPPTGRAFWPPHERNVRANNARLGGQFEQAIDDHFFEVPSLLVCDELYHLVAGYRLMPVIDRHLTQGDGMQAGVMFATQKPSGTHQATFSGYVYNSPTHSFVARDPVDANRRTYEDIGGVPTGIIRHATEILPPYYFLYVHRKGPKICVVADK